MESATDLTQRRKDAKEERAPTEHSDVTLEDIGLMLKELLREICQTWTRVLKITSAQLPLHVNPLQEPRP